MPKIAPRGMPTSTAAMNKLRKWYQDLDLDPIEERLIHLILFKGKHLRWTLFIGKNFAAETAHNLGVHPVNLKKVLAKLVKRGWLKKGIDDVGRPYTELTGKFIDACERSEQRWWVKFTLGSVTWRKINGTDEIADLLYKMAMDSTPNLPPSNEFTKNVKAAAGEVAESYLEASARGSRKLPGREPKATSQVASSYLKLISGERKSGA